MESMTTPQVVDSTATHKICPGCSNFNKFKMTKGKMSGRVCIACTTRRIMPVCPKKIDNIFY